MNIVSFFSGAGGLDLGFALAGHKIIWSNDFDKYAVETYNKNIGNYLSHKSLLADVVELLDKNEEDINYIIPDCDIILGGFPCQGFTIANLDRSMSDSRNFLYLQLLKAISVKQPPYFMLENVKGLENMENGKILPMILDDLEQCGTNKSKFFPKVDGVGYTVVYNIVNALYFGVPENRERVIILGIRNDILNSSPLTNFILPNPTSKKYDNRKRLSVWYTHSKDSTIIDPILPKDKINLLYSKFINGTLEAKIPQKTNQLYKVTTLYDAIGDLPEEYSKEIYNHDGSKCLVSIKNKIGNRATFWNKYAPTIMGRGSGTGGPLIPPHPNQKRRLTVREVARIQTFPDNFFFCGSISAGYRQIGNAVPVLMAYNLALIFNLTNKK